MKRLGLLLLLMVLPSLALATDSYNLGANVVTAGNYVQQVAANSNLGTGSINGCLTASGTNTDTTTLGCGSQKLTLTANDTLTIAKGTLAVTPSVTSVIGINFLICQDGTGNHTLSIAADGTTVLHLYWNGGAQPGYTLTANNGDAYSCSFDGTNLRCAQTMSNQPCV